MRFYGDGGSVASMVGGGGRGQGVFYLCGAGGEGNVVEIDDFED